MHRRNVLASLAGLALLPHGGASAARKKRRGKSRDKARGKSRKRTKPKGVTVAAVDAILGPLALKMGHGTDLEGTSLDDLEAMMAAGQRIIVLCSNQSLLGIRELARHGIQARLVAPWTRDAWNGSTDSHTLLEARINDRWQVYDMTANAQAVDRRGRGIDVTTLCSQRPLHWRPFASDPIWTATSNAPADVNAWYEHVLQIPVIEHQAEWRFHDQANRDRLEALHHSFRWADTDEWRKLTR